MQSMKHTINLGNSIIGVSILAMPFCFKKCGIVLSILLIIMSALLNRFSCHLLLKSAIIARRRNYELLAFHIFGSTGKLIVEISVLGFLLGTCIAFFVVIGDIGPSLVTQMFGVSNGPQLRAFMLTFLGMFVALPLGLLRRVESLTSFSMLSLGLYSFLVLKMFLEAAANISSKSSSNVWNQINYWDSSNLLSNLPIFSMSLSCQTQLFEIFDSSLLLSGDMTSLNKMNKIVNRAVYICSMVYIFVGLFGYIAFYERPFGGNILIFLPPSFISTLTLIAFVFTVLISFPLCLFPCRTSLHSFLFRKGAGGLLNEMVSSSSPSIHMSDRHFRLLTIALIVATIGISVLLPQIELVLGILGSTIGAVICFIFPALIFLYLTSKNTTERLMAQLVVFTGLFILIICTFTTLHDIHFANSHVIEQLESSKSSTFNRMAEQSLDPEAIKKEEKELKLMITPKIQPILHEYKAKQIPTIDANKAKRQEELLQRLERQQQEHKKLLDQQKELLIEMRKHNELHHSLESKKLVINEQTFSNISVPDHSIKKNSTKEHSDIPKAQDNYLINKSLEKSDKNLVNSKTKREENLINHENPIPVVKKEKFSPVLSDKNVINVESVDSNQLNIKTSKNASKIDIKSNIREQQIPVEKQQEVSQNEKPPTDTDSLNKTLLSEKGSQTLLRRSALSAVNKAFT